MIFETDSLVLKKLINGEEAMWPTMMRPILQEITFLLAENRGFKVEYYSRSGNKAEEIIAKETFTFALS